MAILVNFKICDNAKECGGIEVCPTGALSWDEKEETIVIDNDKCISCGACESECPIGAIMVAHDEEEFAKRQKEIDDDPRTTKDLFVDRYGAAPLSEFFMINEDEVIEHVKDKNIVLIELYKDESIQCLLKSIPIKDLTKNLEKDTLFYKVECSDDFSFGVSEFPALLVYKEGSLLGKIEGYYTADEKETLLSKLDDILR